MKLLALLGLLVAFGTVALCPQEEIKSPVLPQEEFVLIVEENGTNIPILSNNVNITVKTDDGVQEIPMDEYLVGVLLCEMPVSFHTEALKAQAVAARTFAARMLQFPKHDGYTVCSSASCCQAWKGREAQRDIFGTEFTAAWTKAQAAVKETEGQVLLYDGKLIEAVYFSCSGGASEPAEAVWGSDVAYLQSVPSPGEENAAKYESEVRVSFSRFKEILKKANSKVFFSVIPEYWIGRTSYSQGGGVETQILGGVAFSGTELRSLFDLNSTKFTITIGNGCVTFHVMGFGHRVGMSQYGANAMAEQGSSYEKILHHYYTNIQIKDLFQI